MPDARPGCPRGNGRRKASLALWLAVALVVAQPGQARPEPAPSTGTLVVRASGLRDARGQTLAKLFQPGQNVLAREPWRLAVAPIHDGGATLEFRGLPFGSYALVVVHDRNANGVIDHNRLRLPAEPLGFSGHYAMSLLAGRPRFEKLRFEFATGAETLNVEVK